MGIKRRIEPLQGRAALDACLAASAEGARPSRPQLATAVRYLLEELALTHPGNSVEVRVPPFGVTQCVEGPRHTRGTPPNVVEASPDLFLALATGGISWEEASRQGSLLISGTRADLSAFFPLVGSRHTTG